LQTTQNDQLDTLSTAQIWQRFFAAAVLTTVVCLPVAYLFLKTTGVPPTYPPLLPQQIIAGTVGGALLVTLGYWLLAACIREPKMRDMVFILLGVILLFASFHLPYRLSYTTSPRFAGVTVAAQFSQGFLHTLVVGLSLFCFLKRSLSVRSIRPYLR
jgi:hypothetical protein